MKNTLRSILFNVAFIGGSAFYSIALLWLMVLPQKLAYKAVRLYFHYVDFISRHIQGITLELRGTENLPKDGCFILAAKHQSAYETLALMLVLDNPAFVLKRELAWVPLWGWYPLKLGMAAIDRGSGAKAMASIIRRAKKIKAAGRPIIIFPQGTRVPVGEKKDYKFGMAKLYRDLKVPIVPMALNSGVFWPRYGWIKKPGKIVFEFLPPISPDLPPKNMMEKLEEHLETASDRLVEEALKVAP